MKKGLLNGFIVLILGIFDIIIGIYQMSNKANGNTGIIYLVTGIVFVIIGGFYIRRAKKIDENMKINNEIDSNKETNKETNKEA